jgi:ABC-type transport system involved in multi-copper enzyme maturation permease subunit
MSPGNRVTVKFWRIYWQGQEMKRAVIAIFNKLASPILTRELRGTFRRWLFFAVFTTTLSIATLVVIIVVLAMYSRGLKSFSTDEIGRAIYTSLGTTQGILLFLLLPGFCSTFISGERSAQSYDLLITTRLKPREIIWGKMLASGAYICTFLFATLPLAAIGFLYGGVPPLDILMLYVYLAAGGMLVTIISMSVSGLFKSVVWSVIVGYLVVFAVLIFASFLAMPFGILWALLLFRHGRAVSPSSGELFFLAQMVGWFVYASIFTLFFISAVNRVKPASANRSTAMRIYATCVVGVLLVFLLIYGLSLPFGFTPSSGLVFGLSANKQSVRVLRKMYKLPSLVRIFFPGGRTGLQFTILSIFFWFGLILIVSLGAFGGHMDSKEKATLGHAVTFAVLFLISYALIGFCLSTTKMPQWGARMVLLAILFCNVCLPPFLMLITTSFDEGYVDYGDNLLQYFSPIGAINALSNDRHLAKIAVSYIFHMVIIIVFSVIALARSAGVRRLQLATMDAMPLKPPSPESRAAVAG